MRESDGIAHHFTTGEHELFVALTNGKLAVDDPNTIHFVTGAIVEARSFDDPCPPTRDRLTEHNDEVDLGTRAGTRQ
ncbi:MAG: hypothetical protein ABGZ17_18030, partial [Planctomycetaceae bacterium]